MRTDIAIYSRGLTRRFGDVTALDGLDLKIPPGEIYGVVGPDGAGKTTAMRILCGIMEPTSGEVRIFGKNPQQHRELIGYMPQRFGLYEDLTVHENLHFYAELYGVGKREREDRLRRLMAFSQLGPFQRRRAGQLSGGMKQKLALACALIHTPEVLILDEPTCGVDPVSRRDFWRILYELLREGVNLFISTAYLDEAERCHRVGLLHQGKLLIEGTPQQILARVPGHIYEVDTPESRRAQSLMQGLPDVMHVGVFGQRLHLALQDEGALSRVLEVLEKAKIPVTASREIPPTLEDAYISVIGGKREEGRG